MSAGGGRAAVVGRCPRMACGMTLHGLVVAELSAIHNKAWFIPTAQVAAMEVMGRLPAASDAVRRQAPQSGAGAAGPGVRAKAAAASFVPGDWQSWSGLAAPGLTGSGAELMLDDILDLQEALARHVEQLRPRCGRSLHASRIILIFLLFLLVCTPCHTRARYLHRVWAVSEVHPAICILLFMCISTYINPLPKTMPLMVTVKNP